MELTTEQLSAAEFGQPVTIEAGGKTFVLLSQSAFASLVGSGEIAYDPMTLEEMDLLADEAHEMISQSEPNEY